MVGPGNKRRTVALGLAAAGLIFAAAWAVVDLVDRRVRMRDRPDWLTVEASLPAVVGRPFELRVTLADLAGPELIVCGLRWTAADRRITGELASAGPARETRGGEILDFRIEVREKEEMRFVSAVIYLSPTGRWQDRTRGASTELIPVRRGTEAAEVPPPRALRMSRTATPAEQAAQESRRASERRSPPVLLRLLLVVVLLSGGALCGAAAVRQSRGRTRPLLLVRLAWAGIGLILIVSGVLETFDIPDRITEWARLAFMERDIYEMRRPLQGAAAVTAAAVTAALLVFGLGAAARSRDHRWLWAVGVGVVVYLSMTLVGMTSFHPIDVLRRITVLGVSAFHAARGAGAVLALVAAAAALQKTRGTAAGG